MYYSTTSDRLLIPPLHSGCGNLEMRLSAHKIIDGPITSWRNGKRPEFLKQKEKF